MMNKRGWLKIVEAFFAILLITIVMLVVIGRGNKVESNDVTEKIYDVEVEILTETLDEFTQEEIANDEVDTILEIEEYIENRVPNYLECELGTNEEEVICKLTDACEVGTDIAENENLYVQTVPIIEKDKKLKLACWIKKPVSS